MRACVANACVRAWLMRACVAFFSLRFLRCKAFLRCVFALRGVFSLRFLRCKAFLRCVFALRGVFTLRFYVARCFYTTFLHCVLALYMSMFHKPKHSFFEPMYMFS